MSEVYKFAFESLCENNKIESERRIQIIKECIEAGIDISYDDSKLLITAIQNKDNETVNFLIDNGIDFKAKNNNALQMACMHNNSEIIKLLLRLGAEPNSDALLLVNDNDIIKLFIEYGVDPFANSNRLFIKLCRNDINLSMVEYLISIGANCSEPDNEPIAQAFKSHYNPKIRRLLLDNKADPNAMASFFQEDSDDICLLELCIVKVDLDGCKLLFEYGVDINHCHSIINKKYRYDARIYKEEKELALKPIIDLFMEQGLDITEYVHRTIILI